MLAGEQESKAVTQIHTSKVRGKARLLVILQLKQSESVSHICAVQPRAAALECEHALSDSTVVGADCPY